MRGTTVTVPSYVQSGTYYIGAIADKNKNQWAVNHHGRQPPDALMYTVNKESIVNSLSLQLALLFLLMPVFSFSVTAADDNHQNIVSGELLVKFRPDVPEDVRDEIHDRIGSEVVKQFHSIRVEHVRLGAGLSVQKAIELYESDPNVEYAEPVGIAEIPEKPGRQ